MQKSILHRLPAELFLEIADLVSMADQQCLRYTCRAFYNSIPQLSFEDLPFNIDGYFDGMEVFGETYIARRTFITRMIADNIIWERNATIICVHCLAMKSVSPLHASFTTNDLRICVDCLALLARGVLRSGDIQNMVFGQSKSIRIFGCIRCSQWKCDDMHTHDGRTFRKHGRWCTQCHMLVCKDIKCTGWPEHITGWIYENWCNSGQLVLGARPRVGRVKRNGNF